MHTVTPEYKYLQHIILGSGSGMGIKMTTSQLNCCLIKNLENKFIRNRNKDTEYKKTQLALVRERTIPTERPPPVGEVSANFGG